MAQTGSDLTAGLQTRLSSSLPLNIRCRLAVNTFTTNVFIPGKEKVVLDWLLISLDLKYRERLSPNHTTDDTLLWDTLDTCLTYLATAPPSKHNFCTAPDILLNILPYTDLTLPSIVSSISSLISFSSLHTPDHPNWSNLLTLVLSLTTEVTDSSLIASLHTAMARISLDPTQDHSPLLVQLSALHLSHPHPSLHTLVSSLLFSSPDPYTPLFSHLSGVEGKYHPGQVTSVLLTALSKGCSPLLIMSTCPDQPAWLRASLFSMLLSTQGCSGLVDSSTVEGGKLMKCLKKMSGSNIAELFRLALPLELSLEVAAGHTVAKNIQDVVRELIEVEGITDATECIIGSVYEHHPQILEPLVALILGKNLERQSTGNVFKNVLDVMLKLRQLPKLISKLFLHIRSSKNSSDLGWSQPDLEFFGSALSSLPRVQYLEMWKTLNYHFTSDILAPSSSFKADQVASVLSPLLSTVLLNSQLADHNLPSSLLPRIQDLSDTTLSNLQTLFRVEDHSGNLKKLVVEITYALTELSKLFVKYREMKESVKVSVFAKSLVERIVEKPDWQESLFARKMVVSFSLENPERELLKTEDAVEALELYPGSIDQVPDATLLNIVRSKSILNPSLFENSRFCGAVIYALLEKMNKQENFFIPEFDHWKNDSDVLDSYLGKSLVSCFTTLLHSELPGSELCAKDLDLLKKLPLENLPSALKLGATLTCLSQVYRKGNSCPLVMELTARCLESTDIFRYVDAGKFLTQMLALENVSGEVVEVVAVSVGRFTKTIRDVEAAFLLEESVGDENNLHLKACVRLLGSLSKSLSEGAEGTDKKEAGKALADRISKHLLKVFKKRNIDNLEQIDSLCEAASEIVKIFSKKGLGKMSKMVHKMVEISFSENCKSWRILLGEICNHLEYLDGDSLPNDWKLSGWQVLATNYEESCSALVRAILKVSSSEELEQMLRFLLEKEEYNLSLWKCIILSEVAEGCSESKKAAVEEAVTAVCKLSQAAAYSQLDQLPDFLSAVFSSSPPCVSTQLEIVCLGCLLLIPVESAQSSLSSLATFLSHRGTLSTRTIPITTLVIRNYLSPTASVSTLHALQKVLGLFSRHKADYSSVLPHLVADLLNLLSSSPPQNKTILTTSLYPLLDMLDKHSFEYLSSNLGPANNEIFKHLLNNFNSSHKFKGKV